MSGPAFLVLFLVTLSSRHRCGPRYSKYLMAINAPGPWAWGVWGLWVPNWSQKKVRWIEDPSWKYVRSSSVWVLSLCCYRVTEIWPWPGLLCASPPYLRVSTIMHIYNRSQSKYFFIEACRPWFGRLLVTGPSHDL